MFYFLQIFYIELFACLHKFPGTTPQQGVPPAFELARDPLIVGCPDQNISYLAQLPAGKTARDFQFVVHKENDNKVLVLLKFAMFHRELTARNASKLLELWLWRLGDSDVDVVFFSLNNGPHYLLD